MPLFTNDGQLRMFEMDLEHGEILGDRYLLERVEIAHETASGIELPGQNPEVTGWQCGRVYLVGNGHRLERNEYVEMFYKPGDLVICERFSGRELTIMGRVFLLMNQTQIFCKIPERSRIERETEILQNVGG